MQQAGAQLADLSFPLKLSSRLLDNRLSRFWCTGASFPIVLGDFVWFGLHNPSCKFIEEKVVKTRKRAARVIIMVALTTSVVAVAVEATGLKEPLNANSIQNARTVLPLLVLCVLVVNKKLAALRF